MTMTLNDGTVPAREPAGSEPSPQDLQAMLAASAGLGARGAGAGPATLLGGDEEDDDEYGPKQPKEPKARPARCQLWLSEETSQY